MRIGGLVGSVGTAVGSVTGSLGGVARGVEGGSAMIGTGAASISGLARFDTGPAPFGTGQAFRAGPVLANLGEVMKAPLGNIVNEGPVKGGFLEGFRPMNRSDITTINKGGTTTQSLLGEILFKPPSASNVIQQAESILSQARVKPVQEIAAEPEIIKEAAYWFSDIPEPKIVRQDRHTLVRSSTSTLINPVLSPVFPALEPAVGAQSKTEVKNATRPALPDRQAGQAVAVQPALQEQEEEVEEMVEEKVQKEEKVLEEEEIEELSLKDVVDEEVLNRRLEEFGSAAETAGAWLEEENLQEIDPDLIGVDGSEIVKRIPVETAVSRSGIVKKQGPDGSREETIEEVASRRFRSIKEAKERIAAIIAQKVPVKRAKEGKAAGYEAVARVLKYFFVKARPAEQLVTRVVKKQRPVPVASVAKPEVKETRIEDLGLSDLFPKAA